jgi:DNA gyrase/topoisomerase IV subunit B
VLPFVGMARAGGTHVEGLVDGLQRAAKRERMNRAVFREIIEPGLVAIVNVWLHDPRFENPSREWLVNPEVRPAVAAAIEQAVASDRALQTALAARFSRG